MISMDDPGMVFEGKGFHPFVIGNGPSESALVDSQKLYPGYQRIFAFFEYLRWGSPNFQNALACILDAHRNKKICRL